MLGSASIERRIEVNWLKFRCYRMIYNDVKERNRGYELPSFPEMSKEMREMFEMLS